MLRIRTSAAVHPLYHYRTILFVAGSLFSMLAWTPALYAQNPPCMVKCGTTQVACSEANNLLCGTFDGSVDILVQDPRTPDRPLTVTTIDLGLILDDNTPNGSDWRGYVVPAQSYVFPIMNPEAPPPSQRGPDVSGSNQRRNCTENNPCLLTSQSFYTPVSGTNVQRQFMLMVTKIIYQDPDTQQTPRALVGQYLETISNYAVGRVIQVNGTFRLERSIPIAPPPKG